MKCNVAVWDQILRLLFGTLLLAWAVAGGPAWSFVGLPLLATGAWRFCPLYFALRAGTARDAEREPSDVP